MSICVRMIACSRLTYFERRHHKTRFKVSETLDEGIIGFYSTPRHIQLYLHLLFGFSLW